MSDHSDSSKGLDCSQGKSYDKCEKSEQERFYKVYADIGEIILGFISGEFFILICRRIGLLARSTILPSAGVGNARACAAMMDMTEGGFKQLADRRFIPRTKPGDELLYAFADLTKTFEKPSPTPDAPPTPSETKHGRCANKKPVVPRGKRQAKK